MKAALVDKKSYIINNIASIKTWKKEIVDYFGMTKKIQAYPTGDRKKIRKIAEEISLNLFPNRSNIKSLEDLKVLISSTIDRFNSWAKENEKLYDTAFQIVQQEVQKLAFKHADVIHVTSDVLHCLRVWDTKMADILTLSDDIRDCIESKCKEYFEHESIIRENRLEKQLAKLQ